MLRLAHTGLTAPAVARRGLSEGLGRNVLQKNAEPSKDAADKRNELNAGEPSKSTFWRTFAQRRGIYKTKCWYECKWRSQYECRRCYWHVRKQLWR